MLEHYGDIYKGLLSSKEGPRLMVEENGQKHQKYIKDIETSEISCSEYNARVADSVRHTLKDCGGDGKTYSDEQKKLMVWYTYFFLNRGKPSTHIEALSKMGDETLVSSMPPVFEKMIFAAEKALKERPHEDCYSRKVDAM